ncbi:hypothetical protein CK623_00170 [Vandammella animalimorsus]|uniref:Uncharacterized protein n=1 Tax=Vandammella animalimorsus TaxID=2029117 RepID=A0A2A2AUK5_9BURK|nr:hypothetical protein [Vandammella animalimorsus]PAT41401.1 hypothetical protein CK623_00170 [Vandammella animalimorsus]
MTAINHILVAEQDLRDEVALLQGFIESSASAAIEDSVLDVVLVAVELRIDALRARIARFAAVREGRPDDFCG